MMTLHKICKKWEKITNVLTNVLRNIKLELCSIVLLVFTFIIKRMPSAEEMLGYFTVDRLNGIATFFSIAVGVYIAVITIFATTEIGISKEMLKRKLDKPLIIIIMMGIIEDFIVAAFAIFVELNGLTAKLLVGLMVVAIVSFGKFLYLLIVIFRVNMDEMARSIDKEESDKDEILTHIAEIAKYCRERRGR